MANLLLVLLVVLKVMFHETIRNEDSQHNTAFQHCCDTVWNSYNIVSTLQCCVALRSSLRIVSRNITFMGLGFSNQMVYCD